MRRRLAVACFAAALFIHRPTRAEDSGVEGREAARRSSIVAVARGPSASWPIHVGEVEDQIAAMPSFQRQTFGRTADAIRRRILDDVLIPDAVLSLGAKESKLEAQPAVRYAMDRALSSATVRAIQKALATLDVPMDDVRAYYDRNRSRYDAPARYQLWRILCATREEAQQVLDAAVADGTPKVFAQLARDHSQDKATALRSGNLGFLTAEGESSEPGLRVDPATMRAAQSVRDGDFVRTPVPEGQYFAVVWRRGTLTAQRRSVEEVAPQIREILKRQRTKDHADELVASLRAAKMRDLHEELLDGLDL